MKNNRSAGILLHPSSLPGPDGIGDFGPEAYRFVNFLRDSGCALWQVLPLGPTGYGDSPYQCFSAFAGNPILISNTLLLDDELLTMDDLKDRPLFADSYVEYGDVIPWKFKILDKAFDNFNKLKPDPITTQYHQFIKEESDWLLDFALFLALKEYHNGSSWENWDEKFKTRQQNSIEEFRKRFNEITDWF